MWGMVGVTGGTEAATGTAVVAITTGGVGEASGGAWVSATRVSSAWMVWAAKVKATSGGGV